MSDWITQFTDPFAVLGVAVTADDRRVQKRYRQAAKSLHPDRYIDADATTRELTEKLLARLINPAYEKLQQDKERQETIAILRLKIKSLTRNAPLSPNSDIARQLMECPVSNVEVFYEQAFAKLADTQFDPHSNFAPVTEQLMELNLVYLQLKMGDLGGGIQEKRNGLISVAEVTPKPFTPPPKPEVAAESYDQRHYRRAQEYAKKRAWSQVVQELRDAIRIKADKSEYHSLLGVAYLYLDKPLPGMAKVHFKRALELNPQDTYGLRFGPKLGISVSADPAPTNGSRPQNGTKPANKPASKRESQRAQSSSKNPFQHLSQWVAGCLQWVKSLFGTRKKSKPPASTGREFIKK